MKFDNEEERENIKFVTKIILYLLLAIAFFSFSELENQGVKYFAFFLFISAIILLICLSFMFIFCKKGLRILYMFVIPFVYFFILIFINLLFTALPNKGGGEGIINFINNIGRLIKSFCYSEQIQIIFFLMLFILIVCIFYQLGKRSKSKSLI